MAELNNTKYYTITTIDGQVRLIGKYGFVFGWSGCILAACLESPKITTLKNKFLKEVPGSKLYVFGDQEAIIFFLNGDLKLAAKVLKLYRKNHVI